MSQEQNEALNAEEQLATAETTEPQAQVEALEPAALEAEIVRLQTENNDLRDQALRAVADMQNSRRRADQDIEKAHKFGQEKLLKELLNVVDNLERALDASKPEEGESGKMVALREGVELTRIQFMQTLEKFQVQIIDPEGQLFDPQLHEAMSMVEQPELPNNTVLAVLQKGYSLHGRLLRPAMVMVSKGGQPAAGGSIHETA